jgi:hypothetical protein
MAIIKPVIITPETESRFQSFVLFEPSSSRVSELDILVRGEAVKDMFDTVLDRLSDDDSLKTQIIRNKLAKINQMLGLLTTYEHVVISRFFDRIWRRYGYISNISEPFLDLKTFLQFFPEYKGKQDQFLAQRLDDEDEEDMEGSSEGAPKVEDEA